MQAQFHINFVPRHKELLCSPGRNGSVIDYCRLLTLNSESVAIYKLDTSLGFPSSSKLDSAVTYHVCSAARKLSIYRSNIQLVNHSTYQHKQHKKHTSNTLNNTISTPFNIHRLNNTISSKFQIKLNCVTMTNHVLAGRVQP